MTEKYEGPERREDTRGKFDLSNQEGIEQMLHLTGNVIPDDDDWIGRLGDKTKVFVPMKWNRPKDYEPIGKLEPAGPEEENVGASNDVYLERRSRVPKIIGFRYSTLYLNQLQSPIAWDPSEGHGGYFFPRWKRDETGTIVMKEISYLYASGHLDQVGIYMDRIEARDPRGYVEGEGYVWLKEPIDLIPNGMAVTLTIDYVRRLEEIVQEKGISADSLFDNIQPAEDASGRDIWVGFGTEEEVSRHRIQWFDLLVESFDQKLRQFMQGEIGLEGIQNERDYLSPETHEQWRKYELRYVLICHVRDGDQTDWEDCWALSLRDYLTGITDASSLREAVMGLEEELRG